MNFTVDLNCDMGEGMGNDEAIMPFISSSNIACGYHAGDENTMKHTVDLCMKHNVGIGAHPSFFDKENFGRTDFHLPPSETYDIIVRQIHLLDEITKQAGGKLHHIKPHGALYNMAARSSKLAAIIALAVKDVNEKLIVYGLSGSHIISEAKAIGLKTASEVFGDRTYRDDGSLTPRSKYDALIEDGNKVVQQVLQMIKEKMVTSVDGKLIPVMAETICVHGDGKYAAEFSRLIHDVLIKGKIKISQVNK